MTFTIRQNATLPKLKLQLEGKNKKDLMMCLLNADIQFSMTDTSCGMKVISCRQARLEKVTSGCANCIDEEYLICIDWNDMDTMQKGLYKGEFDITFNDTQERLILPIGDDLTINVI